MSTAAPAVRPQPLYFVNAPIDFAVMGGLSILAAVVLQLAPTTLGPWPTYLAIVCNWPHFAATSYRLYHSRDNLRQYPATAFLVPVLVIAGFVWSLAEPTHIAPMYVKLMLLWSPYHFSGQTMGLCLGYARRAGFTVRAWERNALDAFLLTSYLSLTAHVETGTGMRDYAGLAHPKLGLAPWVGSTLDIVAMAAGCAFLVAWLRPQPDRRRLPPIVLLPAIAQGVWFVLGRHVDSFQQLVPFFHSLEYLFIAWAVQLKERLADGRFTPSTNYVRYETIRWWLINVALGVALFVAMPYALSAFGFDLGLTMALGAAAIQLHHFFVDGVIWKLRNPKVASPLLVTLQECSAPAPPLAEAA